MDFPGILTVAARGMFFSPFMVMGLDDEAFLRLLISALLPINPPLPVISGSDLQVWLPCIHDFICASVLQPRYGARFSLLFVLFECSFTLLLLQVAPWVA